MALDNTGFHTDLEYLSGATFKVVGAALEGNDFSFSFISVDLTEDIGIGAGTTHVPRDHRHFIVDHCQRRDTTAL